MRAKPTGTPTQHGRFYHAAAIYRADEELLAVALPFLRDGAAAGEPTLLAANEHEQRVVGDELGDLRGITLLDQDHSADALLLLRNSYALHTGLVRAGAAQIRVLGGLPNGPWRERVRYEAAMNHFFSALPVWAICPYDTRDTPDDVLADVERTHPHLTSPRGLTSPSPSFEDPAALLNQQASETADPLQDFAPDVDLVDPSAARAGQVVMVLAQATRLDHDSIEALRLSVGQLVGNALVYGHRPVHVRVWSAADRVVVTVRDAGAGPADPFVGLLPRDPHSDPDDANCLYVIHQAVTEVSMFTAADGFTVRLVQRPHPD